MGGPSWWAGYGRGECGKSEEMTSDGWEVFIKRWGT